MSRNVSAQTFFAFAFALLLTASAFAQDMGMAKDSWKIDPNHSEAQFSVRHLGISSVRGSFTKVGGMVTYDAANVSKSSLKAEIEAASLDTRVEMRDKDVKGPSYLDVAKYPTITFMSKRVEAAGAGKLKITGDLTIHGVSKEVVLDVDGPSAPVKDPWGNMRMGASASTKINRNDYGVSGGSGMVGDDITITLDIEMTQPMAK